VLLPQRDSQACLVHMWKVHPTGSGVIGLGGLCGEQREDSSRLLTDRRVGEMALLLCGAARLVAEGDR
jgi:hypothetical protein